MVDKKIEPQSFEIRRIYIKDISFESPNTPSVFDEKWNPTINFDLNTVSKTIKVDTFEVILQIRITVKSNTRIVFLCDVHQAGIFFISNVRLKILKHFLGAYCPNILFPYARERISNLVLHAGFPQLNISPINFDSLFYKKLELDEQNIKKNDFLFKKDV